MTSKAELRQRISDLEEEVDNLEANAEDALTLRQKISAAESDVRIHKLAIRQLESQNDGLLRLDDERGFAYQTLQAQVGELKETLAELASGMRGGATRSQAELLAIIDALVRPD